MVAIVPARGGSKGVPDKNIKLFCGKPLIFYTIREAQRSFGISDIVVSTDSERIAESAVSFGAKCPFMRPAHLSTDSAKAIDNYIYTINRLNEEHHYSINEFVVLQPTSPLRQSIDIDGALDLFSEMKADSVISVTTFQHPLQWAKRVDQDGRLREYFEDPSAANLNRQEITAAYVPNGAIFVLKNDLLVKNYSYYSENTYAYQMDPSTSIDIDTVTDFEFAEFLMRKRHERS